MTSSDHDLGGVERVPGQVADDRGVPIVAAAAVLVGVYADCCLAEANKIENVLII